MYLNPILSDFYFKDICFVMGIIDKVKGIFFLFSNLDYVKINITSSSNVIQIKKCLQNNNLSALFLKF